MLMLPLSLLQRLKLALEGQHLLCTAIFLKLSDLAFELLDLPRVVIS
jgi:hypothetical protein